MREEKYLESVQRDILRSKKWKRFVRRFDIGKDERVNIKALPIRFTFHIPGDGDVHGQYMMQCLPSEILVAQVYYDCMTDRIRRLFLFHELIHHYLRANDVPHDDHDPLFKRASKYLHMDMEIQLVARYRRLSGKDRSWKF